MRGKCSDTLWLAVFQHGEIRRLKIADKLALLRRNHNVHQDQTASGVKCRRGFLLVGACLNFVWNACRLPYEWQTHPEQGIEQRESETHFFSLGQLFRHRLQHWHSKRHIQRADFLAASIYNAQSQSVGSRLYFEFLVSRDVRPQNISISSEWNC